MPVDYSKWNHIEVSDDEDDTHPNIDTPSLFKWRHEARVQRMEEMQKKKETAEQEKKKIEAKLQQIKERLAKEEAEGGESLEDLKKNLTEAEKEAQEAERKRLAVLKEEKSQPLNVDTLSREGFSKCVINTGTPANKEPMTDEEKEKKMKKFVKENTHLACDETANYLVIWCLDLEMESKTDLMEHVAHQCICMQDYKNSFYSELDAFKVRIKKRAQEKIAEALEEERQERLGPGGLDPVDVFESLPERMRECFESQDIPMLQQVIKELPEEEARYHMKRCVDSGLWVPSKEDPATNTEDGFVKKDGDKDSDGEGEGDTSEKEGEKEEEIYEEVK